MTARLGSLDSGIAVALQANARATWREIASLVGSSESTVARRARALIESGRIRTTVSADAVRCGLGNLVLVQLTCAAGTAGSVAATLAAREDVRFVAMVTGPFDVVAEFVVPSNDHLAEILIEDLATIPTIIQSSTEIVLRNFKTSYVWAADILPEVVERGDTLMLEGASSDGSAPLDALDLELLRLLQADGRRSFSDLAIPLGISEPATRRRYDALVIGGFMRPVTLVNPKLLGFDLEVFVWLQVDLATLESTAETLTRYPGVRYVSATSGYSDLVAEVVLHSNADLYRFRTEVLGSLSSIRRVDVALELRALKRGFLRF